MSSSEQPAASNGRFFSIAELAQHLRLSRRTVERSVWSGALEHYRIGARIIMHESAALAWLESHRITRRPRRGSKPALEAL